MANKGQAFMGLAVALAVAAAVVGYFGLNSLAAQTKKATLGATREVVVTANDLTFGTKLEKTMLRTVRYPTESVPVGAFSSIDSVVGQTTKVFMTTKEPVTRIKLSSLGGGLSMLVREGMRAASLEVNQVSGVSGFILPGDRVDMLVTILNNMNPDDSYTQTVLQNLEVLAAGQTTTTKDNKPITVQAVTVLVAPKEAEVLAHATRQGQITLVLRARGDDSTLAKIQPVKTSELGGKVSRAAPARVRAAAPVAKVVPPPARAAEPKKVTIIRRTSKSEEALPSDTTAAKL